MIDPALKMRSRIVACLAILLIALTSLPVASAQKKPTVEQFISPPFCYELVSAKKTDRIAWIAYERGMRNVFTAAAPDFKPVRLTPYLEDDGNDLTTLRISDDGSTVIFIRGHSLNREGWVANPTSDPQGAERAVWAARTIGGKPWKVIAIAGNPALSPDGRSLLYTKDGQIYRAVVAPLLTAKTDKDEKPFFKVLGTNSNPRWSPDGRKIAFTSNRSDHTFIGVYDVMKKTITYLTPSVDHDTSPAWSPDSRRVAFIRRPGTPFGQQGQPPGGFRQGGFPPDGATPPAGRQAEQQPPVTNPIKGMMRAAFKGGYNLSFWVADAETGEGREFWHNAADEKVFTNINNIQWADRSVIFSLEPEEWIRWHSVAVEASNSQPVTLTPGDGMVENVGLTNDGKFLYYSTNATDIDRRHVWKVPTAGGDAVQLTTGNDIETFPVALASGSVAMLAAGVSQPQSVAVLEKGGKPRIIYPTVMKDFPAEAHVAPENVTLTAPDGLKFNNQLFLPRDLKEGERRAAIIFVHGGPRRQMLLGYHYIQFYHVFYSFNQYLASQGYIVLSVNYRSGIGYGKKFREAPNTGRRGNAEYQDVLAAGKYLQSRADVDPKRVGIWGLSYGGLLTAQALARNSDVFVAGVDLAGVHLWGTSVDPKEVAYKSSPISEIEKWKSPVLLIHGDDDRNVAFSQTTGLVQLLRAHNVPHELIVLPDDIHETLLHHRWIMCFNAMDKFLNRHLKGNEN